MKRYIGICMAAVLALGVALTVIGGEGGDKKAPQTKTGVVKKVDQAAKTIVVMVKRELTFTVTGDTKILQGDATKTLADIKEGDSVTVEYTRDGDNRVALKVSVAVPTPAKVETPAK